VCEATDATIERPKQFQWIHDLPPTQLHAN
jgi:hypothetical protein